MTRVGLTGQGLAGFGRCGQYSDHLFFGAMVEYPTSGRFRIPDQGPQHGAYHAGRHVDHGIGVLVLRHCRGFDEGPVYHSGTGTDKRMGET